MGPFAHLRDAEEDCLVLLQPLRQLEGLHHAGLKGGRFVRCDPWKGDAWIEGEGEKMFNRVRDE